MPEETTGKPTPQGHMELIIELNGTDENPYHMYGLKYNPIPQTGNYRWDVLALHLQKLGGDPIPDTNYIRRHLDGWDPEFVDLCCSQFRKGEVVRFIVHFPEELL